MCRKLGARRMLGTPESCRKILDAEIAEGAEARRTVLKDSLDPIPCWDAQFLGAIAH